MSDKLNGYYHQDGEWDVSMSNIEGEDLGWVDQITLVTSDGTRITLQRGGSINIEGDFEVESKR